jgi:hypothetical protein
VTQNTYGAPAPIQQPQYAPQQQYGQAPQQQYGPPNQQQYGAPQQQAPQQAQHNPGPAPSPEDVMGSTGGGGPRVPLLGLGGVQPGGEWRGGLVVRPCDSFAVSKPGQGPGAPRVPVTKSKDGSQIWGLRVYVATDFRDPQIVGDTGERAALIDGVFDTSQYTSKRAATLATLQTAGVTSAVPPVGSAIYWAWDRKVGNAYNWQCHYVPPTAESIQQAMQIAAATDAANGQQPGPAQQAAPVQQQYAPAAPQQQYQQPPAQQYAPAPPQAAPQYQQQPTAYGNPATGQYVPAPQQQYAPAPQQAPAPVQQPAAAPIQSAPPAAQSPEAAAALGQLDQAAMAALQQQLGAQPMAPGVQPTH